MKKYLFLLISLFAILTAEAQLNGDGYYRVQNYGTKRWAYLRDNYGKIDMGSQQADCGAIQLWKNTSLYDDPSSIIYVRKITSELYDLEGQGTGLYQIISHYVSVMDRSTAARKNTYWVYASQNGITKYLDDDETGDADDGACGFNRSGDYRYWSVFKVDGDANYLGVTPTVKVGSDYYQPYYVSFPFSKTSDIKVYYISKIDPALSMAVLSEYTGDIIPAGMPVLIKCVGAQSNQNKIMPVVSKIAAPSGNLLKGVYFNTPKRLKVTKDAAKVYDGSTMRVLGVTKSGKLGFINSTSSLTAYKNVFYLNANQAYLPVAAGTPDELTVVSLEEYEELTAYRTVTVEAGANGKVGIDPVAERYKIGTTVKVTATPDMGYSFASWSNGVKDNPYTFTVSADTKLTAAFAVNKYTLTFDTDGGSAVPAITQDYGTTVKTPAAPTRSGYTFAGWDQEIPSTMPAQNMTFKARWTVNSYTITYNANGGSQVASTTGTYGSSVSAPADPTREGYTFNGWVPAIPSVMPAGNMTVTAQWTVNRYTINFDSNGGSDVLPITQDYGTKITSPIAPTRTGYTFAGWDVPVPSTMPAANMTLHALWTINQYTLSFDSNGGSEVNPVTQDYLTAVVSPEDPTREGYTFSGWIPAVPSTMPAENLTVTAQWAVNKYTITFDSNGGSDVPAITQNYGTKVNSPVSPTRTGYTFAGWDNPVPATMPATDMTLRALWTINQYTLTFNSNGGSEVQPVTQDYLSDVSAPADPVRAGYTFVGWNNEIPSTMPASNQLFTAIWQANQYKVVFMSEGEVLTEQMQDYGTEIIAPANPEREGYTFSGWSPTYTAGATVPVNGIVYTAIYKVNPYKIIYMVDDEVYATEGYDFGESIVVVTEPERTGYTFGGWSEIPETMPAGDVVVNGHFSINQYQVSFLDEDGHTVYTASMDYKAEIVAPTAPEKEGYTFVGWTPAILDSVPAHDVVYTAQYEVNTYKVRYYFGEELLAEFEVAYQESIPEYYWTPENDNIVFNAWIGEDYGSMPAHDVTYVADYTDGLQGILASARRVNIYTLDGKFVKTAGSLKDAKLPAGLYIVNSRKVLVK